MQADQDARIIVGFKEDSNADEYLENLKANLLSILDSVNVKEGDAFF
jgi:mannose-6-phosphate isomerase